MDINLVWDDHVTFEYRHGEFDVVHKNLKVMKDNISNYIIKNDGITYRSALRHIESVENGVIIFFTSAKSKIAVEKGIFPYFSRLSWAKDLSEFCTIFVADPFELSSLCEESHGSWFIGPDGVSLLPVIANLLTEIIGENHGPIITYGSSMGGYASLVCGNLLGAHASVAECPQIELFDYPLSKKYLNKIVEPSRTTTNLFEFLRANFKDLYIFIYVNIGDISHISYIYSHLCDKKYTMLFKKLNKININR